HSGATWCAISPDSGRTLARHGTRNAATRKKKNPPGTAGFVEERLCSRLLDAEELDDAVERLHECVDVGGRVVEIETRARGAGEAELLHQRLVAVMAAAERDGVFVGKGHDVVRVHAFEGEADHAGAFLAATRTENANAG